MNIAIRLLFYIPLIGWMLKDTIYGAADAKYYFIGNLVILFVLALYYFGYPFLICFALTATAFGFVFLVALTSVGLFGMKRRGRAQAGNEDDGHPVGEGGKSQTIEDDKSTRTQPGPSGNSDVGINDNCEAIGEDGLDK